MGNYPPEPIAFPDIEAVLRFYLTSRVAAPVSTGVPSPRPAQFVVVRRTGGALGQRIVEQAMVTVECWASTTVDALALASEVRAHLIGCPGRLAEVYRYREFSGPASLPDPTSGQARYTWTAALDVRGSAA